jgi:alkylation response protein AidB-like acyl-CoA dehydrogenase
MFSFELNEEQKMLVSAVSRFAGQDLRRIAHDADEQGEIPASVVSKGWELGLLQASIPEQYGGFGDRSALTGALALEELAWGDLAGTLAVTTPSTFAIPLLLAGSEEQKQTYLAPVVLDDWQPYTSALIEPNFNFDPNELKTLAREEGEEYIIQGEKTMVPFADQAEMLLVYARLHGETQGFIVPKGHPGLKVAEREKLMGIGALPVYRVCFEQLRVPKSNRLGGPEGHDFNPILDAARLATAALAIGLSRAALEYSADYAKEREVFGMKAAQKQAVAFMIAEMATEIEAIRLLTWEAAWMLDQGKADASKHAYLALTGATDMAMMVTDRAVQILGGHGYIREHPVELWMRNGRGIATITSMAIV